MNSSRQDVKKMAEKKWLYFGILVALLGTGFSIYSTFHYIELLTKGATDAFCNINQTFQCDDVAKSAYSHFLGIPLGVWGEGYFLGLIGILIVTLLGISASWVHAYVLLAGAGVIMSLLLFGISWFLVGKLCITCMGIYIVCFLQGWIAYKLKNIFYQPKTITIHVFLPFILLMGCLSGCVLYYELTFQTPSSPSSVPQTYNPNGPPVAVLATKVENIPYSTSAYSLYGEDYRQGGENAKVVIQKFSDFQCPGCQNAAQILDELHLEFQDQILIIYRNFPLDNHCNHLMQFPMHPNSCAIAQMARCAGKLGKFWAFYEIAFSRQREASSHSLNEWAKEAGLSDEDMMSCAKDPTLLDKIKADIDLAQKVGVDATPTLYLNGRKILRRDLESLRSEIKKILAEGA